MREPVIRGIGFGFNGENDRLRGHSWVPIAGYEFTDTDMLLCLQSQKDGGFTRCWRRPRGTWRP